MKFRSRGADRGFTLVELMVAMVMAIFLIGGILLMHNSGRTTFIDSERVSRIQENVRFATDYMIRDVRNAGFRDETFLRTGHELQIQEAYATVIGGNTLRIRYAGRGSCTEAYNEFRLVENQYTWDANTGQLTCSGRSIPQTNPGSDLISSVAFDGAVGLVDGLTGIGFQLICPDGGSACACDLTAGLANACIGVRVALQFEGMREMDMSGDFQDRAVELTAAFRNIILERVNEAAWGEGGAAGAGSGAGDNGEPSGV